MIQKSPSEFIWSDANNNEFVILDVFADDWAVLTCDRDSVAFDPARLYQALKVYYNE